MIKEHLKPVGGVGGLPVTGAKPGSDSTPPTKEAGVTPLTNGKDPYSAHNPKHVPAHNAQLKHHAGDKVAKGGDSQAGSVGGYEGD